MNQGPVPEKEGVLDNSSDKSFFCHEAVDMGGRSAIEVRFETLIASHCDLPYTWYKELGIDKSLASKIRRGLIIPFREWRIKIANYFSVDSSTIWTAQDILGWEAKE